MEDYPEYEDENVTCNACQVPIDSAAQRTVHYKSDWHRYNVKRRCAGLTPISERLFTQKVMTLKQSVTKDSAATCNLCRKSFKNASALERHNQTKKHLKKVQSAKNKEMRGKRAAAKQQKLQDEASNADVTDDDTLAAKMEDLKVEDQPEKKSEMETDVPEFDPPIELKHCLFCRKTFQSVSASVQHMLNVHGFFIPFIEFLTDLEGLLSYLGAKVGMGHVCLWCNKPKGSVQAVQAHMEAKSHCKLNTDEDAEILDYYYFPGREEEVDEEGETSKQEDGALNEKMETDEKETKEVKNWRGEVIVMPKRVRHVAEMNDAGELVMTDGAIIGHRKYMRVYKQRVRADETRESVLINQLRAQYRALTLDGMQRRGGMNERTHKVQQLAQKQRLRHEFRANHQKYFKDINMFGY